MDLNEASALTGSNNHHNRCPRSVKEAPLPRLRWMVQPTLPWVCDLPSSRSTSTSLILHELLSYCQPRTIDLLPSTCDWTPTNSQPGHSRQLPILTTTVHRL